MRLKRYVPILDWLPKYKLKFLGNDLLAGLTVGVMLIPQGMAYGLLAGLDPIYGLYAGIVPLILYPLFGTSGQVSIGPTALVSLLVLAGVSQLEEPGTGRYLELAVITAMMAGLIQVGLGLFKWGFLINFLAHPVISGFTSAAAIIIGLSQFNNLFGLSLERSNQIHVVLQALFSHLQDIHWPTFLLGVGAIVFMLIIRRINRAIPAALLVAVMGILIAKYAQLNTVGVAILEDIPKGLPTFSAPGISLRDIQQLLPLALTISVISFIESLAIASAISKKYKLPKVDPDQELLALGVTKLVGSFFQAFPTTGSFSRSAVNGEAGAKTGLSSFFAALLLGITLLFFTPLFYYLPKAVLAAIIMVSVIGLINIKEAIHLFRTDRRDFYTLLATFLATLILGIQLGVLTGLLLSIAFMVYQNAKPHSAVLGRVPDTQHYRNIHRFNQAIQREDILIIRFDAQLYFGNAAFFEAEVDQQLKKCNKERLKLLILDMSNVHDLDSTGVHALEEMLGKLKQSGVDFKMANPIGPLRDALTRHGLTTKIGVENCYLSVSDAVAAYEQSEITQTPSRALHDHWRKT
ncbi:MAG TPA: solute carrier family 26 protein [Saprospiraceae bacterium]|nr:solute carrier family 26 protein [Saprospiraceae bacterium]